MKVRTTPNVIKQLRKIGEQKIMQGILFKELALGIESHRKEKTFKEWKEYCKKVLDLNLKEVKGGEKKDDD